MPTPNFQAVVLREKGATDYSYRVVRTTGLEDIQYDAEGLVVGFKANNITYIFLNRKRLTQGDYYEDDRNNLPGGYYSRNIFLEYHEQSHDVIENTNMKDVLDSRFTDFVDVKENDWIRLYRLLIEPKVNGEYGVEETNKYPVYKEYLAQYHGELMVNDQYGRPDIYNFLVTESPPYEETRPSNAIDVIFYENNIQHANEPGLEEIERYRRAEYITKTALYIKYIEAKVFPLLSEHPTVQQVISQQRGFWQTTNGGIFTNPTTQEIYNYFYGIAEFAHMAISDQRVISKSDHFYSIWRLLGAVSPIAISVLDIELRLKFLRIIAKLEKLDDGFLTWESIDFEDIVRGLIWSIQPDVLHTLPDNSVKKHADILLDALMEEPQPPSSMTMFQYIFDETNDIGYSPDALQQIMDHLCYVWMSSKYSFYENGVPVPTFSNNPVTGKPDIADVLQYMRNDDTIVYNDEQVNESGYSNIPMTLNYKSKKILFFNDTSHDFVFAGRFIIAYKEGETWSWDPLYTGSKVYHMYQAISAVSDDDTPDDLKLRFPQFQINNKPTSILPVFYLAYIDYNKTVENIATLIEFILDVALTLTGIGNLFKLRHLLRLTKLGRLAVYANEGISATDIIVYKISMATIEIAPTVAQYWVNYQLYNTNVCAVGTPGYDEGKCYWYQDFSNWLLLLQLKSGAIEGAHALMIRKGALKLLDDPSRIPADFDLDALAGIRAFGYNFEEFEQGFNTLLHDALGTYNSNVWVKYSNLPMEKKLSFLIDFERATPEELLKLNGNAGELVDCWGEISFLRKYRKEVDFLSSYKLIKESPSLLEEIFLGRGYRKLKEEFENTLPPYNANMYTYEAKGVHHVSAMDPNRVRYAELDQTGNPVKYPIGPANSGYYQAKVEIKIPEMPMNNGWKKKNSKQSKSTFFPDDWSQQKIKEELALAWMQRVPHDYPNQFLGAMSDGINVLFYTKTNNLNDINTAFVYL